jgi:hypothetical protein
MEASALGIGHGWQGGGEEAGTARRSRRGQGGGRGLWGFRHSSRAVVELLDPAEPMELPAIDDLASRRRIFAALLERKRRELTAPELGADPEFDRLLEEEKRAGDPLFLMMAGLAAAEVGVKDALALTRADLATNVAQRELDRIGGSRPERALTRTAGIWIFWRATWRFWRRWLRECRWATPAN